MRQFQRGSDGLARERALLVALAGDLSLPLVHVKSALELINADEFRKKTAREQSNEMQLSVETGLQLVEAYRLLLRSDEILSAPFQPVSIGAVLEEVAHRLYPYAKQYSTDITVDIQGRFAPVLADEASLSSAMEVLGFSIIRAQAAQSQQDKYQLVLGAHRLAENVVAAGVFSNVHGLSDRSLRAARSLAGQARQPLPAVPPGTASGILLADMLCSALWQPLRSAAHRNLGGLVTSLPTSKQLHFV